MIQEERGAARRTVSTRLVEVIVAALLMAVGGLVMTDSLRIGIRWAVEGPQAGYFPFYIGLFMVLASGVTLVSNLLAKVPGGETFVERSRLLLVLRMLVPSAAFVVAIGVVGIYVAAVGFIAFFMWWIGKFRWRSALPTGLAIGVALFVLFEIWFLVPLPKGSIEHWLGY